VREFLIMGLPDLGRVPNAVLHDPWQQNISPALSQLSLMHNQKLFQLTQDFSRRHADTTILYIDINQLFMREFSDAEQRYDTAAAHKLTPQKAAHPCLLEAVDPDPSLLRAFPHNPLLALSAQPKFQYSRTLRQSSVTAYRHCDLHHIHDQASSLNYQENYLAGGIFFDHIHPLTPIHAKIALAICQRLLDAGVYFNRENMAQNCQDNQLNSLLKQIEQAPFPI
jgi:phospholipase/lecithinase/hemolysin